MNYITSFNWTKSYTNTESSSTKAHEVRFFCFKLERGAQLRNGECAFLRQRDKLTLQLLTETQDNLTLQLLSKTVI